MSWSPWQRSHSYRDVSHETKTTRLKQMNNVTLFYCDYEKIKIIIILILILALSHF